MTCREFIEFLWQYLSEELSPAERAKFEEHLARCSPCVRYLKSYGETIKLGKAVSTHPGRPRADRFYSKKEEASNRDETTY